MRTLLLGGLDPGLRDQLHPGALPPGEEAGFRPFSTLEELRIHLAGSQGDLLLLDLDRAGSREALALVSELRSPIPIVALGREAAPDVAAFDRDFPDRYFPVVRYLRKPLEAAAVLAAALEEMEGAAWGVIQGLSLPTLLQMLQMEGKTCTLRVTSGRRQGFIYVQDGCIINARYRRLEGLPAALELIDARSPRAEIDCRLHDASRLIDMRLEEILMAAAQYQDERSPDTGTFLPDDLPEETPASEIGKWDRKPAPAAAPPPPRGRWRVLAVAGCLALGAAGFLLRPGPAPVEIQSTPPGARVTVDGIPRGATPLKLSLPRPLRGAVNLELAGHLPLNYAFQPEDRTLSFVLAETPPPAPAGSPAPAAVDPPTHREPAHAAPTPARPRTARERAPGTADAKPKQEDIFDQLRKDR